MTWTRPTGHVTTALCQAASRQPLAAPDVHGASVAAVGARCDAGSVNGDVRVGRRLTIPARELSWRFSRSSGPGGQGVNTTDSRVELRWSPSASTVVSERQRARLLDQLDDRLLDGDIMVVASEHREQLRNREAARRRLGAIVDEALRPVRQRRPTRPTLASRRRRLEAKGRRAERKQLRRPPSGD